MICLIGGGNFCHHSMSRYETRLKSHRVKPEKLAFKASFPIIETHLTLVSLEVSMELEAVAKALKELGHPTRLCIYKEVVKAGYKGIAVGGVQEKLGIPASTLSHHISSLASAGLITQRREGRILFCVAEYECLDDVIDFLRAECCVNECQ
ncbi:ArsR family transcriptional regulator [Vibrio parahaemolyticus]|nr:ArsR family transcriptional regulator [Vibrio parahaemolyticus]